jgi:uncharacterized protein YjbI with pentapeptide repeats
VTDFVCEVNEDYRSACEKLPFYDEHEGERYCVLHFPEKGKETDFRKALETKLDRKDFNFRGIWFPGEANFSNTVFDAEADFSNATFLGKATFAGARFDRFVNFFGAEAFGVANFDTATFGESGAGFSRTVFRSRACFSKAVFNGAAVFEQVSFKQGASFGESCLNEAAWFPSARFRAGGNFLGATFREDVNFRKASCHSQSKYLVGAQFSYATFEGEADFHDAVFMNAAFEEATFQREANFTRASFDAIPGGSTDFRRANFRGELYFRETKFDGYTDFYRTNFLDAVKFIGRERAEKKDAEKGDAEKAEQSDVFAPEAQVSLRRARIEKPELFSFDTLRLHPSWLVGVDPRKFDFNGVGWYGLPNGPKGSFGDEIKRIRQKGEAGSPYSLLAQACQRLAANTEENRDYPTANEFHYWSMEALRKEGGSRFGLIATLYWALSGYGVRSLRAFVVLILMSLVFAVLYSMPAVGADYSLQAFAGSDSGLLDYFGYFLRTEMYSLGALARLNPEPKPTPGLFQTLVIVEGIVGPLQIALLALAIRRKVMR